jgi:hypothetical protein
MILGTCNRGGDSQRGVVSPVPYQDLHQRGNSMKHFFSLLTAAVCLLVLPGAGWAVTEAGIPPMLETQHPISVSAGQPAPRAPKLESPKPVAPAATRAKTKRAHVKTGKHKTNVASKKKATKTAKKKSATAKPRSKVAAAGH